MALTGRFDVLSSSTGGFFSAKNGGKDLSDGYIQAKGPQKLTRHLNYATEADLDRSFAETSTAGPKSSAEVTADTRGVRTP